MIEGSSATTQIHNVGWGDLLSQQYTFLLGVIPEFDSLTPI